MKNLIKNSYYLFIMFFAFNLISINVKAEEVKSENIDMIVLFKNNYIDESVKNLITQSGGSIVQDLPEIGGMEVKCKANLIPNIKSYSTVQSISPNNIMKTLGEETVKFNTSENPDKGVVSDLYDVYQWDIKKVTNNGRSFKLGSGNHNIVVGIIDSGIDVHHPDLASNLLGGENFVPKDFQGDLSETGDSNAIDDRLGHGTMVAGTIASNGRTKGVAPNIGFKSYRVFDKNGKTNAFIASTAIIKAAKDGVNVMNLSIGGYDVKGKCYWTDPKTGIKYDIGDDMAEYSLYKRAIKYALNKNITVVTSAGNESLNCDNRTQLINYLNTENVATGFSYSGIVYELPGSIKGVINVSATEKSNTIASYSNYGEEFIDVAAPGGDYTNTKNILDLCLTTFKDGYIFSQGTSLAAPKVSATAALILCRDKNLTPKEVAKKIYKTSERLYGKNFDEYYGSGLVNAFNALSSN